MIKYELKIREITEADVNKECPYLPDDGEFELFFQTLVTDLQDLAGLTSVTGKLQVNQNSLIEVFSQLELSELEAATILLWKEHWCYLRLHSMKAA